MYVSTTEKHDGWVFYKCQKHGVTCDFWRWELEYVEFLVYKHYLSGDAAMDAIGAAEERREELLKAQELFYMNRTVSSGKKACCTRANHAEEVKMLVGVVVLR
ncbi:Coatomer subunit gamma-2 [Hordeum vulgare]|nr:Coatomer subunit gamma-2 [Hordeum vulgare]